MNAVKHALREAETLTGMMLQELRDDLLLRLIQYNGYDLVIIDMEHGTYDLRDVARMAHVSRLLGLVPLVRPPDRRYASIARVLDAGAQGVMVPRVSSSKDVTDVLRAMKFPPVGERGIASQRGHSDYLPIKNRRSFADEMNEQTILIVQIETDEGVRNVDEILGVEGVDVALVGPSDLSLAYSATDPARTKELVDSAIERVIEAGRRQKVRTGLQVSDLTALERWHAAGMHLLVHGTDVALLTAAFAEAGRQLRPLKF